MSSEVVTLKRSLSFQLVVLYGLGNIVGAGIYVLIGKVAGHAGLFTPLSFLIASLIATLTAFSYSELSARFPLSAGESIYIQNGFNIRQLSVLVGILIIFAGIISASTIVRGFVGYTQVFVDIPGSMIIFILVMLLGSVAAWGIKESVRIAAIFTFLAIVGLLIIIISALPVISYQSLRVPQFSMLFNASVLQGVFVGAFLAFYAFIGFEDMVNVAEEVKNPEVMMPRAILMALFVATVLYFSIALISICIVSPEQLALSDAPLAMVYQHATGNKPMLISLISLFAIVNGALIQIIMASRVCYGLSRQGWIPEILGRVNKRTRTPLYSTFIVTVLILVLALWLPIETLSKTTSFLLFIVFAMVNMALWRIKIRDIDHSSNIISIPIWVPIVGAITSLCFVIFQLYIEIKGITS